MAMLRITVMTMPWVCLCAPEPRWALYMHSLICPSVLGGITIPHSTEEDEETQEKRRLPPPGRSLIVWRVANGITMPAARSSSLRESTHFTVGRCRRETQLTQALVERRFTPMEKRQSKISSGCLSPPARVLYPLRTRAHGGLHTTLLRLQVKDPFPPHLE